MKCTKKALSVALFSAMMAQSAMAAPRVVSSIYPLQQIANAIAGEKTGLVANSFLSPHNYSVKPSEINEVVKADLFIWVGDVMMPQLGQYVAKRGADKATITASDIDDIHLFTFGDKAQDAHDHDETHEAHQDKGAHDHAHEHEHEHDKAADVEHTHDETNEDHAHDGHDAHDHAEAHDKKVTAEHGHDDKHEAHDAHDDVHDHDHSQMAYDPHLWLSTDNAKVIATAIAEKLSAIDSDNAPTYQKNLELFIIDVDNAKKDIEAGFEATPPRPYFIFHDAYRYFEAEFGIQHVDKIRAHAGQTPLTKHLAELKKKLESVENGCLFREPQFDSPLVKQLAANTNVSIAVLDPVGYEEKGDGGYIRIIKNIAQALRTCGKVTDKTVDDKK